MVSARGRHLERVLAVLVALDVGEIRLQLVHRLRRPALGCMHRWIASQDLSDLHEMLDPPSRQAGYELGFSQLAGRNDCALEPVLAGGQQQWHEATDWPDAPIEPQLAEHHERVQEIDGDFVGLLDCHGCHRDREIEVRAMFGDIPRRQVDRHDTVWPLLSRRFHAVLDPLLRLIEGGVGEPDEDGPRQVLGGGSLDLDLRPVQTLQRDAPRRRAHASIALRCVTMGSPEPNSTPIPSTRNGRYALCSRRHRCAS